MDFFVEGRQVLPRARQQIKPSPGARLGCGVGGSSNSAKKEPLPLFPPRSLPPSYLITVHGYKIRKSLPPFFSPPVGDLSSESREDTEIWPGFSCHVSSDAFELVISFT